MKNTKTPQLIVGLIVGALAGTGGAWWWWAAPAGLSLESSAHAEAGAVDEHGHAAGAHAAVDACQEESTCVVLSEQAIRDSGIEMTVAGPGDLEQTLTLPGEIALNADRVAHIVPRVAGIVCRVDKKLGDEVQAGEVLALLESRELAEAKAAYLAAQQRVALADANLQSAEELHRRKIMPDLEYLGIEKAKAETEIELRAAGNKLHALGVGDDLVATGGDGASLALYEMRAPFAGTVVEKHCSLGEVLSGESDAFVLADLNTVWANITVYAQDMARVRGGQSVQVRSDALNVEDRGPICYVAPLADEATRSIRARVDLPNADRRWRPGTFITAAIVLEQTRVPLAVPTDAIQRVKGESVLFVWDGDGFEPRPVSIGRSDKSQTEILSGLAAGQNYVTRGAVILKAELGKGQAGCQH